VTLGAGTLVGNGNASLVGTSAATTVNVNSGTLSLASAGRLTALPTVSGSVGSTLLLGGNETVAGLSGGPRVDIASGTLTVNAAADSTHAGIISGVGGLVKEGSATQTLGANNTYSGVTVINSGTLATAGAGGVSRNVTVGSGAALALGGSQTVDTLAGTGLVSINAGTLTVETTGSSTFSGQFGGTGGLAKTGAGELAVSGNNGGYSGPVSVAAGTLKATTAAALGTGTVGLSGGTLSAASGLTIANNLTLGSSSPATWYTQNFNSIGSGLPTGWTTGTAATASSLGTTVAFTTSAVDWTITGAAFKNYAAATGLAFDASSAAQNASPDRALGVRPSSSFGDPGAAFTYAFSTTGRTIDTLSIDMMMLDVEGRTTDWLLQYGIGASPTSFTTLGTWTTPATFGTTTLSFSGATVSGMSDQANLVFRVVALSASSGSGSRDSIGIDNFRIDTFETVSSTASLGATEAGGVTFAGNLSLVASSAAQLTAVAGGTATFSGAISGAAGSVAKTGLGTVLLGGTSSYGGATTVSQGILTVLDGGQLAGTSLVTVAAGARLRALGEIGTSGSSTTVTVNGVLSGDGRLFGTVGGLGSVDPGSSPGILTFDAVDPTAGLDHNFEFTALEPVYTTSGTGALNDLVHLTGASPFVAALSGTAGNAVNVYFNAGSFIEGTTYVGGFFVDSAASLSAFLADVSGAQFNFFIADAVGGTTYEGVNYLSLSSWNAANSQNLRIEVSGLFVSAAAFETGVADGYVTTFAVVPEPSTFALAGIGLVAAAWAARRRKTATR
jgi:autotransporter-associated beta strand protein